MMLIDKSTSQLTPLKARLSELLAFSNRMLDDAEAGNWDNVYATEKLRSDMLEALYNTPGIQNIDDVASVTREMLLINQKLNVLAKSVRNEVIDEVALINKGRKAVNAYEDNSL